MPNSAIVDRRLFLGGLMTTGLMSNAESIFAQDSSAVLAPLPVGARLPRFEFVYESEVKVAAALDFGITSEGHRRVIPIIGGMFHGPKLRGEVVSNGADWNLQRVDGTGSVEAAYFLKTDDGVLIRITNKGVSSPIEPKDSKDPKQAEQFLMYTSPTFEAPVGKYSWMNYALFVGTLSVRPDARGSVLIRVFQVI